MYAPLGGGNTNMDPNNRSCGGRFWCVKDICGIFCAVLTWMLILFAEFVVMKVILIPSPHPVFSTVNIIIFQILAFLAFASHVRTMLSDPVSNAVVSALIKLRCGCNKYMFPFFPGSCSTGQCNQRND